MDYDDPLLAEIYDQQETQTDDVQLIRRLLRGSESLNILECFSGTGRILVPLAADGHRLTGIEISEAMMARAREKLRGLDQRAQRNVTLIVGDVFGDDWGTGYDVVLLACNCFFELPSPEAQEECIRRAADALAPGGHVFVDTVDGSGRGANPADVGTRWTGLEGATPDGAHGKLVADVVKVDERGVSYFVRTWYTRRTDGTETTEKYAACKYAVSGNEVETWLAKHGFEVEKKYGDHQGTPYHETSAPIAVFWARASGGKIAT